MLEFAACNQVHTEAHAPPLTIGSFDSELPGAAI